MSLLIHCLDGLEVELIGLTPEQFMVWVHCGLHLQYRGGGRVVQPRHQHMGPVVDGVIHCVGVRCDCRQIGLVQSFGLLAVLDQFLGFL